MAEKASEEMAEESTDEMTVDFGFRPDRTQRDGNHGIDDPILHNGRVTTLGELSAEGRLVGEFVSPLSIPPYKPSARPAYMATLKGTRKGWEVSACTFFHLFVPVHNHMVRKADAITNYLSRQPKGALV